MDGWTLHLVEPTHFHAALLLQKLDRRIAGPIFVHARADWNDVPFLGWIHSLEARNWDIAQLKVVRSLDPIQEILKCGGRPLAVLAGQNPCKADRVLRLLLANVPVLCDKPLWVNNATGKGLANFIQSTNQLIFLDDCMTERFEPVFELQKLLLSEGLPGFELRPGQPERVRFYLCNTHHLSKNVAGVPVRRDNSFFQTDSYGDPFSDVGIHLVDHYLRLLTALGVSTSSIDQNPGRVESFWNSIDPQTLAISSESGAIPFPMKQVWHGGKGPNRSRITTEWLPASPQVPPECQSAVVHGANGSLVASMDPSTHAMFLDLAGLPRGERVDWLKVLRKITNKLPEPWPHTLIEETRFGARMTPPQSTTMDHAARFPLVFNLFLNRIQKSRPLNAFERHNLLLKYAISAGATRDFSQSLNS